MSVRWTARLVLLGMMLVVARTAHAERLQHWTAESQTARAITGDIDLSFSKIVFQNGASLQLAYVGSARGITWADDARHQLVRIFRILHPSNPRLLNGNTLCPLQTLPTYLTVFQRAALPVGAGTTSGDRLYLTVITGSDAVNLANHASRTCAGYAYFGAGSPSTTATVEDSVWELVELNGSPLTTRQAMAQPRFQLDARTKRMQGFTGCNQMMGTYRLDGSHLSFPGVGTTRRACERNFMEMESVLLNALGATTRYRLTGKRLELYQGERLLAVFQRDTSSGGNGDLREQRAQPPRYAGWAILATRAVE